MVDRLREGGRTDLVYGHAVCEFGALSDRATLIGPRAHFVQVKELHPAAVLVRSFGLVDIDRLDVIAKEAALPAGQADAKVVKGRT